MTDYRDAFFTAYASTHTALRKGELTLPKLEARVRQWETHFGEFLPADRDASILDGGCGDGALLWWLQRRGYRRSEGVEVSAEQVAIARSLGIERVQHAALAPYLAGVEGRYSLIILRNVLEHFRKEEVLEILRLSHHALQPGGHLVVQVPNGESPFFGRIRYGDFTHELAFCTSSLSQVFNVIGFESHRFRPVRPVFGGMLGPLRALAWRGVETLYGLLLAAEVGTRPPVVTLDILAHTRRASRP
jgi:2-polyprenyl-3-methyl-5-hydroxy-6-metoxy-1,4-benzoquinol methylase